MNAEQIVSIVVAILTGLAACIPLALDELNRGGLLHRGDNLVLCGFGGGLSSAACVLRW